MSARSEHLNEEAGLLVCYGKSYDEEDDDCSDCPLSGDCETLTELRREQKSSSRVARRMPAVRPRYVQDEEEEEEEETRVPWAEPEQPEVPPPWQIPFAGPPWQPQPQQKMPHPQYAHPQYMIPAPPAPMSPYMHPGLHSTAQIIPHPAPHLTYMASNPVDCPMPIVDESWYGRVAKNVLSGVLSEGGRQFYEFFRRFRF